MATIIVDGHEVALGREPSPPDPRDARYPMALAMPSGAVPRYRYWRGSQDLLNQGAKPHCVAYSYMHHLGGSPIRSRVTEAMADALYAKCKQRDGIPNLDGTYPRVAADILREEGKIEAYLWARTSDELKRWILTKSPAIIGVPWRQDMFTPDAKGVIHPTGPEVGGHAVLVRGYSENRRQYRIRNSWGGWWGQNGECWISDTDMEAIVWQSWGEALSIVEKLAA